MSTPNGHQTRIPDKPIPMIPLEAHLRLVDEQYRAQQRAMRDQRMAIYVISFAAIVSLIGAAFQIASLLHQWGWW